MRKLILPSLFTAFFILESIIVEYMPAKVYNNERILVPHVLLMAILFLTIYVKRNTGILYAFIFGMLFDVVYTEILGIYFMLFPLIAYLVAKIMKVLQTNVLIVTFVTLLGIVLLELGVYEMNVIIQKTDMDFSTFASIRLLPTFLFNLMIMLITVFPLTKLFEKIAVQLNSD